MHRLLITASLIAASFFALNVLVASSAGDLTTTLSCVQPPMGLVSWWRGEGNTRDIVGTNDGTPTSITYVPGKVGQAFYFNGLALSHISVADRPSLDLTGEITIEFWYNSETEGQLAGFIGKRGPGEVTNYAINDYFVGLGLYYNDPSNCCTGDDGNIFEIARIDSPQANVYHHFAGTYRQIDQTRVELNIFIDGILKRTLIQPGNLANAVNDVPLIIGSTVAGGEPFFGIMDEVTIYRNALTGPEIQSIFAAGSAGKCTDNLPALSPIALQVPFAAGESVKPGGLGSFYGDNLHRTDLNDYYATDWSQKADGAGTGGMPIYPVAEGDVAYVGWGDLGYMVVVEHDRNVQTSYGHMVDESASHLHIGQHVSTATQIGQVGDTGAEPSLHLHLRFRVDGRSIENQSPLPSPMDDQPIVDNVPVIAKPKRAATQLNSTSAASLIMFGPLGSDQTLEFPDGRGQLALPSSLVVGPTSFKYVHISAPVHKVEDFQISGNKVIPLDSFILVATDLGSGAEIHTFPDKYTITLNYQDSIWQDQIRRESALSLAYWNGSTLVAVPSSIDTVGNQITAELDHMTEFALVGPADDDPPTASPTVSPAPNVLGWSNGDVTIAWNWTDGADGSGIDPAHCTASSVSTGEGTQTLNASCTDLAGNTGNASYTVSVDKTAPVIAISMPQLYSVQEVGTALDFSASDTLSGMDGAATASVSSASGSSIVDNGYQPGTGVYLVVVSAKDRAGNVANSDERLLVIYDPDGGFVTGGGWIMSPAGAYAADQTLTGRATFGFESKYKSGASVPTGNTEFQFKTGNLNFKSTSYDWLVIAGQDKAKYKGVGKINGAGSYNFLLTAIDNGSSGDKFHVKIWGDNGVVYDNAASSADDEYDGTVIGGGSIQVHKK